jgi:hypothetical protein
VDEFNATSIMGMLKEVFVDHTIDGEEIPPNVLWVGAMNPYDTLKTFVVRPHPPSMDKLILNFGTFTADQEDPFIGVLLAMRYTHFFFSPLLINHLATKWWTRVK